MSAYSLTAARKRTMREVRSTGLKDCSPKRSNATPAMGHNRPSKRARVHVCSTSDRRMTQDQRGSVQGHFRTRRDWLASMSRSPFPCRILTHARRGGIAPFEVRVCVHPFPQRVRLQLSTRQSRELSGGLDAPERICRQFFRMLPEHIDPSACKLRNDAEKFSW